MTGSLSVPLLPLATMPAGLDLVLLTHQTEFSKSSNTGVLVADLTEDMRIQVRRLLWSRVAPDQPLLARIASQPSFLLYPCPQAQLLDVDKQQLFWQQRLQQTGANTPNQKSDSSNIGASGPRLQLIILDATWQLARKMYNQSAYLKQLPAISLDSTQKSVYQLRRNQQEMGWCTAESVSMLLSALGYLPAAAKLQQLFLAFNQPEKG
jgi:DTW domain-containing protein YfiP